MGGITGFIQRWKASGGSEQANSQLFLAELCDVLDLSRPEPYRPVNEENTYSFERKVFIPGGEGRNELKRLDLYRKGCFVLESKQGQDKTAPLALPGMTASSAAKRGSRQWEDAMQRAKRQAENYIRCLPANEGRPPFLIVADVGFCFDLYSEFSRSGGVYLPFPDARNCRVKLDDLEKPEVRALFQAVWNDPLSLDPSRRSARVTEEVAAHLAELARLLEADGHGPEKVSQFLMRCIFTMFAEDVSLIPANSFTDMLQRAVMEPSLYAHFVRDLWIAMNNGTVSVALGRKLLRFNGNIFANPEVLPLTQTQIGILLEAAKADWQEVEPAIFGTLLERALDPRERHKLGAHYTPRAYVERLVIPTVMQPLREEWDDVQAAASLLSSQGKTQEAGKTVADFHKRLLRIRVLDPACGSGNFLYVTMEHMKRLEGEVLQTLATYGERQTGLLQIDPHQFLGLEINPRAAHIAEMVLWIGWLQWHFRTYGNVSPPEPVIRKFENIQNRDALIAWNRRKYATDTNGRIIIRWNGETYKTDPATGRQVPDESAAVPDEVFEGVTRAEWPKADFIVGNPPFVGNKRMRLTLGSGYSEALRATYAELPESCDFVMYWWHRAAEQTRADKVKRFGFITTNSITQVFNRRVMTVHLNDKKPLHLAFAVPDHPWVDASDGAAVRIAMTVGEKGAHEGRLASVTEEHETDFREHFVVLKEKSGLVHADLTVGADVLAANPLKANEDMSFRGVTLVGEDFVVTPENAEKLGLGRIDGLEHHIRLFLNGRDITEKSRGFMVIDLLGLTAEKVKDKYPEVYQWLYTRVRPERSHDRRASYRDNWWIFAEPRKNFRSALTGLSRFIATVEVSKHRFFCFLSAAIVPSNMLVNITSADAYHLGVLSSRIHVCWALAVGGTLEDRPRYNNSVCFAPFPFPVATSEQQVRIRDLGEKLDAHRKARQSLHPDLTMTGMYNALEALRAGRELTAKEKTAHEQGLVTVLRQIHDELDRAVADAYGWPVDLPDEEILPRLVTLNAERAEEEKQGKIRWLRPEYQTKSKEERKMVQAGLDIALPPAQSEIPTKGKKGKAAKAGAEPKIVWPSELLEQTQAVRGVVKSLQDEGSAVTPDAVAWRFVRAPKTRVEEILRALETLGFV